MCARCTEGRWVVLRQCRISVHSGWGPHRNARYKTIVSGPRFLLIFVEFPRKPIGILKRHIADEADNRLAFYLPLPQDQVPPEVEVPPRPQLPDGVADAPLVRVFNFLRKTNQLHRLFEELICCRDDVPLVSVGNIVLSSEVTENTLQRVGIDNCAYRQRGYVL